VVSPHLHLPSTWYQRWRQRRQTGHLSASCADQFPASFSSCYPSRIRSPSH